MQKVLRRGLGCALVLTLLCCGTASAQDDTEVVDNEQAEIVDDEQTESVDDEQAENVDAQSIAEDVENTVEEAAEALDAASQDPLVAELLLLAQSDPEEMVVRMQAIILAKKEEVLAKAAEKLYEKDEAKLDIMLQVMFYFGLAGALLVLVVPPISLRKKYPDKGSVLVKFSALASATFFVAILLFMVVLFLLRVTQGAMIELTNPKLAITESVFDGLHDSAQELGELAPTLIIAPLASMAADGDEEPQVAILKHAETIVNDVETVKGVAASFQWLSNIMAVVQDLLVFVAIGLFILGIKDVLLEIVKMPARAAAGEIKGSEAVKSVFRTIGREFKATLLFILAVIVIAIVTGILLTLAVSPATEALLAYVLVSIIYLMVDTNASTGVVYTSLIGSMIFLVLAVAVVIVGSAFFLGKFQRIAKLKYHHRLPLKTHKRFFTLGMVAMIWAMLLPFFFVLGAAELIDFVTNATQPKGEDDMPNWSAMLLSGPLILVAGFALVFWALRGVKALGFIKKYDERAMLPQPEPEPEPEVAPAGAAA